MATLAVSDTNKEQINDDWRNPSAAEVSAKMSAPIISNRKIRLERDSVGDHAAPVVASGDHVRSLTVTTPFEAFKIGAERQSVVDAIADITATLMGSLKSIEDSGVRGFLGVIQSQLDRLFFETRFRIEESQTISIERPTRDYGPNTLPVIVTANVDAGISTSAGSTIDWTVATTIAPARGPLCTRCITSADQGGHQGAFNAQTVTVVNANSSETIVVKASIDVMIPSVTSLGNDEEQEKKLGEELQRRGLLDKDGNVQVPKPEEETSFWQKVAAAFTSFTSFLADAIHNELAGIQVNSIVVTVDAAASDAAWQAVDRAVKALPSDLPRRTPKPRPEPPAEKQPKVESSGDGTAPRARLLGDQSGFALNVATKPLWPAKESAEREPTRKPYGGQKLVLHSSASLVELDESEGSPER